MSREGVGIPGESKDRWAGALAMIFIPQILGLAVVGWLYRHSLNSDAVAYLRLAHYYAEGPLELAVSGNWGPMLSWLLAPLLKAGLAPLTAARVLMGLSAVWFLWASTVLFRVYALSPRIARLCAALIAVVTIPWSVENITPDLLVGGFICLGVAALSIPGWLASGRRALSAGVIWGAAYLAKAIAFPLALLTAVAFAALWKFSAGSSLRISGRAAGLTLLAFSLVATPWVTVLSLKYGRFTFSTTRAMMHAAGDPRVAGGASPPFLGARFETPAPGRLTIWEDPSVSTEFAWSPVSSWSNAARQLRQSAVSFCRTQVAITSVYAAWWPLVMATAVVILRARSRPVILPERFGWPLMPVLILNCLYLPQAVSATEHRYFFSTLPLLLLASFQLGRAGAGLRTQFLVWGMALSALLPALGRWAVLTPPSKTAAHYAHVLSEKLRQADIRGPFAGNAFLPRGRTGLYLAFLMEQPWLGDEPNPTAESYRQSGAGVIVVRRDAQVNAELKTGGDFQDLDTILFTNKIEAHAFPVKVYQLHKAGPP